MKITTIKKVLLSLVLYGIVNHAYAQSGSIDASIDPGTNHQEMQGFGGAITWYCDRVTSSPQSDEIAQLLFEDLGTDILRLKNWYYPAGYPSNKNPSNMEVNWFVQHFNATNELYNMAMNYNPEMEVLLSSWTPPSALKSNDALEEGTLAQEDGAFMYEEFAQYWVDVLDNISFNPDYISIQNEPGYITPDWETCEWRPNETSDYPGYEEAFDQVYQRIQNRSNMPMMIGPEAENIGPASWDFFTNIFSGYSSPLSDKDYLEAYAYHLYNFQGGPDEINHDQLNMIRDDFGNKPNFMTEFSGSNYDWLQTADAIHQTVTQANASAYIYWEMMWDESSDNAMIQVDGSGNYTIQNHYYTIKHFAKHIDEGYRRINVSVSDTNAQVSAYLNPAGDQITVVIVNNSQNNYGINFDQRNYNITGTSGYQSIEDDSYYQDMGSVDLSQEFNVPGSSITTLVLDTDTDCNGEQGGTAFIDSCGNCAGGNTGVEPVTDPDACVASVKNKQQTISINCYPNPFSKTIQIRDDRQFSLSVHNITGRKILERNKIRQASIGKNWPSGIYILKIKQGTKMITKKIIKK